MIAHAILRQEGGNRRKDDGVRAHMDIAGDDQEDELTPPHAERAVEPSNIRVFRFDRLGIRRVLGSLEADVLEAVWGLTPGDAAGSVDWTTIGAVCQRLGPPAHYKTIQTVMNRLVEKQLLARRQRLRAFEYRALVTRSELEARVARSVVEGLVRDFGDVAIAQLVKVVSDIRPEQLEILERLAGQAASATEDAAEKGPLGRPRFSNEQADMARDEGNSSQKPSK